MMDFINSANDIWIALGICDYLGKIDEIDLERRQNTASVVPTPRISETATVSRACAADNFTSHAGIAEGNFSTRASAVEGAWHACSARSAEGNLRLILLEEATKAVVERPNEKNSFDCVQIADNAEILKIGRFLQTRPAQNSNGFLSMPCGEADRPTSVEGGQ